MPNFFVALEYAQGFERVAFAPHLFSIETEIFVSETMKLLWGYAPCQRGCTNQPPARGEIARVPQLQKRLQASFGKVGQAADRLPCQGCRTRG